MVTMKASERLRDYTNRFFENRNTYVSDRDDQVDDNYKKGVRGRKVFEMIHESGSTKVAPLMDVVSKLIDTEEALVNQFDHDGKQDAGTSGAAGEASSKFCKPPSEVLPSNRRRPSTFNVKEFNTVLDSHAHSMKGEITRSASANSSTGHSARPTTQSDPEATGTGHPHVATTTAATTTGVDVGTTITVTTGDVTTSSRKTDAMSTTCLPRRRQATPTARSSRARCRST
jgi:hypothetical protein